jgi:hypothetical protein
MKLAEREAAANAVPSDAAKAAKRRTATRADHDRGNDAPLPLPHETNQSAESQHEEGTREVGRPALRDLSHGLTDTDYRSGDAYQERTQNDANANTQSSKQEGTRKR